MLTKTDPHPPEHDVRNHVLVVDDEPLIRWSLSETLEHLGYTVVEAGDARAAVRVATEAGNPFGVVVLDVRLPDCDDLTLLARLRRLMASARIILMTAHGTPELERQALDLGAYCVMHKPFEMVDLAEVVEQARQARTSD